MGVSSVCQGCQNLLNLLLLGQRMSGGCVARKYVFYGRGKGGILFGKE